MNSIQPLRCGLYLRKACCQQTDIQPYDTHQLEAYFLADCSKKFGKKVHVGLYHDIGFSGMHTERPALQRLLRDVLSGEIDIVAFPDFHHLSRNNSDLNWIIQHCISRDVKLINGSTQIREAA